MKRKIKKKAICLFSILTITTTPIKSYATGAKLIMPKTTNKEDVIVQSNEDEGEEKTGLIIDSHNDKVIRIPKKRIKMYDYYTVKHKRIKEKPLISKKYRKIESGKALNSEGKRLSSVAPIDFKTSNAVITSYFGRREAPTAGASSFHKGIDIAAPEGTYIYSVFDGQVAEVIHGHPLMGNAVIITHGNGRESIYMHMSKRSVNTGDIVSAGDIIGTVGNTGVSTGPHLHFEFKVNGISVNPINLVTQ